MKPVDDFRPRLKWVRLGEKAPGFGGDEEASVGPEPGIGRAEGPLDGLLGSWKPS